MVSCLARWEAPGPWGADAARLEDMRWKDEELKGIGQESADAGVEERSAPAPASHGWPKSVVGQSVGPCGRRGPRGEWGGRGGGVGVARRSGGAG